MTHHPVAAAAERQKTEAALVGSILAGDAQAFESLMRQHNRRLFRVARSIVHDDGEAEDVVQEGYVRAYKGLAGFRGEARLSTWLTRIVVNLAIEHRRHPHLPEADAGGGDSPGQAGEAGAMGAAASFAETPETLAMRGELRRLIEASVDALPEAYRSVFILRAVEGLSVEETAASLGISEANTKTRLLRARAQLRRSLGQCLGPLLENVFAFAGSRCDSIVAQVCARLGLATPSLSPPAPSLPPSREAPAARG
ncbi:ECF subfamily RNA polymerase, sigma-24 subunit [Oryzomicrobium terrae]|uniref:ECF subfamily RNA polymerase, sigma-24 subunit n=1 Tax=Oryzomicrobium terrae TaxID=1735038 RepID=A0A5C1E8V1_9RHOO|nr:RNA polymerase sigma factor [Oryzomicrobium terrae]QEL64637.1 ECF subfamily RNA polymerase, sigma-24 subunit [Oryzomicrobium terrae]